MICHGRFHNFNIFSIILLSLKVPSNPPSENRNFSATKHLVDLKPVSKLEFVPCGPVENPQCAMFNRGSQTKFENTFLQIAKLRFLTIFDKISEFSTNSQGISLKACRASSFGF